MYNVIDLFCGAGGLSLGFEMEDFNVLAGFEIEEDFLHTYTQSHPNTIGFNEDLNKADILKLLKDRDIEDISVVVGGPPCQGFSTLGNRMIDDERNNLVRVYADIIDKIKPKIFLMENVAGLSSMKNGKGELIKDELTSIFDSIGYNVQSKVLLAADYGVPQLRRRIFFVGIRKDYTYNFTFPNPTYNNYLTVNDAISDLAVIDSGETSHNYELNPQNDYQELLRSNSTMLYNHRASNHSSLVIERIKNIPQGGNHSDLPEGLKLKKVIQIFMVS